MLACEESFAIQTSNGTIAGRFDRIEKTKNGIKIIDFKTSAARSEEELQNDLQLTLYVYAGMERWNTKNIDVSLLILSEKECQEQCTKRTEDDLQIMLERVKETSEHILQKKFTATPSIEKCMHCPYKNICRSAKKVPLPSTGTSS